MFDYTIFYDKGMLNKNKLKKDWIKENYPSLYLELIDFEKSVSVSIEKFSQLIWHYKNQVFSYPACDYCGKENRRFYGMEAGYKIGCGRSCAIQITRPSSNETRKKNTMEKWGVSHTTQLESTKRKMKETNLERFGFEHPSQSREVMNRIKKTNLDKYGYDLPLKSPEIKNRMISGFLEKWGVDNPIKSDVVKEVIKRGNLKKWGVEWQIATPGVKEKIKAASDEKFRKKIVDVYKDLDSVKFLSYDDGIVKFGCLKCGKDFDIRTNLLHQRYYKNKIEICINCNPLNSKNSSGHLEIVGFLKEIGIENISINCRKTISPYEIDIYLPDYRIGIEFNGVYWHSELIKDKDYHIKKRILCEGKDLELLQIWEDDWNEKRNIVKSILKNRLDRSTDRIYARRCEIRKVTHSESKEFLNKNHMQGWSVSKWRLGLFYRDELVSLMTFSKGRKNLNSDGIEYELVRFCNRLDTNVVGSMSRLWKSFLNSERPEKIISYCDMDLFGGAGYTKLGMLLEGQSLNYTWCDGRNRWNRWRFRKDVLVREGFDKSLSELEIMKQRGWWRCWGSGNSKYVWIYKN